MILRRVAHFFFVAVLVAGCASGSQIRSDFDRSADFASYNTYNFMENAGPDTGEYQSFFSTYMIEAITLEMEKRGYVKSDDPDLLVNFNGKLREKTDVRTTPASPPPMMVGGYYGYRTGLYGGWGPSYGYGTETHVSQYTEGTFNIDLVDARRMQLVWEAIGVGRVTEEDLQNLEEGVRNGVPNFFATYPFIAGSATPVESPGN